MEDVGGGSDRVGAQEQGKAAALGSGDETHGEGVVAGQVPVRAGGELRGRDLVSRGLIRLGGFAVRVTRAKGQLVRLGDLALELGVDPAERAVHRAAEEPVAHAEGEEVLGPVDGLGVEANLLHGGLGQLEQVDGENAVARERTVLQRIRRDLGLLEVDLGKAVGIDDQDAAGLEVGEVGLERGGIHGDQDIDRVARGEHVAGRKVHLETGDPGEGALRSTDLGGEVRERGEVVAEKRRRVGELAARHLHSVARVAAEADDRVSKLLPLGPAFRNWRSYCRRHDRFPSLLRRRRSLRPRPGAASAEPNENFSAMRMDRSRGQREGRAGPLPCERCSTW